MFFWYLTIGLGLISLQALAASYDSGGYLLQSQMRVSRVKGYSFFQHGGTLMDIFCMTPIGAYIFSHYDLKLLSLNSLVVFGLILLCVAGLGIVYASKTDPEKPNPEVSAYCHGGETTLAGWLHGIYAIFVAWALVLFFFTVPMSATYHRDIILISIALTPFFHVGARMFNENWRADKGTWVQSIAGPIAVWSVTACKLYFNK